MAPRLPSAHHGLPPCTAPPRAHVRALSLSRGGRPCAGVQHAGGGDPWREISWGVRSPRPIVAKRSSAHQPQARLQVSKRKEPASAWHARRITLAPLPVVPRTRAREGKGVLSARLVYVRVAPQIELAELLPAPDDAVQAGEEGDADERLRFEPLQAEPRRPARRLAHSAAFRRGRGQCVPARRGGPTLRRSGTPRRQEWFSVACAIAHCRPGPRSRRGRTPRCTQGSSGAEWRASDRRWAQASRAVRAL